jgi:hypothetical protein
MIKPEELKDKNFKIFLGMPMYGGMLTENTMHGLLQLQQWSMAKGVGMRVQTMGNESLITRARNTIVSMMMDQTTMMKKFPERKYESDQIINGKSFKSDNCYDLFAVGPYQTAKQKRYLSEDYYFSRLWQECGGDIWADIAMPLTHFGNRAFKGHVGSLFAKKDDVK